MGTLVVGGIGATQYDAIRYSYGGFAGAMVRLDAVLLYIYMPALDRSLSYRICMPAFDRPLSYCIYMPVLDRSLSLSLSLSLIS